MDSEDTPMKHKANRASGPAVTPPGYSDPSLLSKNAEHLMKRCFSVVAASVIAGGAVAGLSGCEQILGAFGLSESDDSTISFPEKDAIGIKIKEKVSKTLGAGDLLYFTYSPGNFWVTVKIESIELSTGAVLRYATSSGAPTAGAFTAVVGERIVDSLPDQPNFICVQCVSGTATVVFSILDGFASIDNTYSDWVDNWSDYSNWSNYGDSYSRYAAYSDSWLNYSNYWINSW